jgi:D-alanine-D-alanine ligase
MAKKLKVLLTFDDPNSLSVEEKPDNFLKSPERESELNIYHALKYLGYEVKILPVFEEVGMILSAVQEFQPDIVFNQVEQFCGDALQERNVMGLFEMLKVPYTGTGPGGLLLCKNKGLTKEILTHHRIKTPDFLVIPKGSRIYPPKKIKFPIVVKPLREEASYGISLNSFVENDQAFIERVRFVHESMGQDVIAEEYVEGRELYVSLLGNKRPRVLPIREVVFENVPDEEPKMATFKAKWDEDYRHRWGIENRFANNLSEEVLKKIETVAKKVFKFLYLKGYARLDIRLTPENEVMVLEVNPNPHIAKHEDFASSAAKGGIGYIELIKRIIQLGFEEP